MLPTVVITNWVHEGALERLKRVAEIIANPERQPWPAPVLEAHLRKADAVVTFMPDRINEEDLRKFPRLKLIACALKGYDNFDITACTRRGITVTIVEDLLTIPSAELAIGLMIGLGRHLLQGDTAVREGKFHGWRPWFYGLGLHGSTVGLIGLGTIGHAIAQRLLGFGSNQIYYDSRKAHSDLEQKLRLRLVPLEEILSQSDFVVLSLPLTLDTKHLINESRLKLMKPSALLINPARGSLVDEKAVGAALVERTLGGYAADVFELEDWARVDRPETVDSRILADRNKTLLTPHLGSAVEAFRRQIAERAIENVIEFLEGRRPPGAINAPE